MPLPFHPPPIDSGAATRAAWLIKLEATASTPMAIAIVLSPPAQCFSIEQRQSFPNRGRAHEGFGSSSLNSRRNYSSSHRPPVLFLPARLKHRRSDLRRLLRRLYDKSTSHVDHRACDSEGWALGCQARRLSTQREPIKRPAERGPNAAASLVLTLSVRRDGIRGPRTVLRAGSARGERQWKASARDID